MRKNSYKILVAKHKERNHMGGLGLDWRFVLK